MTNALEQIRTTAHLWRTRFADGEMPESARAEFEQWIAEDPNHAAAFAEAEILWEALGQIEYDAALDPLAETQQVRVFSTSPTLWELAQAHWQRLFAGGLVAACAAFAVVLFAPSLLEQAPRDALVSQKLVYQTEPGTIEEIALKDGSTITLGALSQTEIAYGPDTREVRLGEGTAFFDVVKDPERPFIVWAGDTRIEVTGTKFDVQRRDETVQISVAEGSVRVTGPRGRSSSSTKSPAAPQPQQSGNGLQQTISLSAGEKLSFAPMQVNTGKTRIAQADIGAWRSGQLVYVRATLGEVVSDLNRYAPFPVEVDESVSSLRLSGTFAANEPEILLDNVAAALPVKVVISGQIHRIEPQ
ncbi:MAG: FecR domain-containing protein [Pseudomonadota bacterium]